MRDGPIRVVQCARDRRSSDGAGGSRNVEEKRPFKEGIQKDETTRWARVTGSRGDNGDTQCLGRSDERRGEKRRKKTDNESRRKRGRKTIFKTEECRANRDGGTRAFDIGSNVVRNWTLLAAMQEVRIEVLLGVEEQTTRFGGCGQSLWERLSWQIERERERLVVESRRIEQEKEEKEKKKKKE